MSNQPVTYAKAHVYVPGSGMQQHASIQQHVAVLVQEPDYGQKHALAAFRKVDLDRLFGASQFPCKEFYLVHNGVLTYVGLREREDEGTERFATVIALNQKVLDMIFGPPVIGDSPWYQTAAPEVLDSNFPVLRMSLLVDPESFSKSQLVDRVQSITYEEYKNTFVKFSWTEHADGHVWTPNDTETVEDHERPRMHLKDIPLTTRASRTLVRDSIEQHRKTLEEAHARSGGDLSFEDWMTQVQGVQMAALKGLEQIDALPDEQYVEAIVTFKKAEAQAMHSQAINTKQTELHLFDWVKENFGEEFQDLGRASALADIAGIEATTDADLSAEEGASGTFLVVFDGAIVENQYAAIGPLSPYALATLQALKANGHFVVILTQREFSEREMMLEFLKINGFVPNAIVKSLGADDLLTADNGLTIVEDAEGLQVDGVVRVDYVVDHRQFGAATVNITGDGAPPTFYWGDLVQYLQQYGYLDDDDVQEIMASVLEEPQAA